MEAVILTLELDTTQFIIGHMYTMLDPKMTWKKKRHKQSYIFHYNSAATKAEGISGGWR